MAGDVSGGQQVVVGDPDSKQQTFKVGGMTRVAQFAIFFSIALSIIALIHGYLWLRLVRDPALPSPWSTLLTTLIVILFLGTPVAFLLWRLWPTTLARWIVILVYFWMGMAFVFLFLLLAVDLFRLGGLIMAKVAPLGPGWVNPERRLAVSRIVAASVVVLGTGLSVLGAWVAHREVAVHRLEIALPRFPRAMDGFTIVQLTDLHLGPTLGRGWFDSIVRKVNALRPDLIVITGDLADGMVDHMREVVAPLEDLHAEHGVYFVTGNHEYYAGVDEWLSEIDRMGVRVLRNERVSIGQGESSFDLAGIDDYDGTRMAPGHGPDLARALEGRDPDSELILLAHQPRAIREAAERGVGLQLSGHTHGGQIWPWSYLVYLQQPYVSGLHQHGNTLLYVSSGTGYWGPPMRLLTRGEIVHLTLHAQEQPL